MAPRVVLRSAFCVLRAASGGRQALRPHAERGTRNPSTRFARSGPARHATRAFTLVELLLVIIIIGTLAAIVVPRFAGRSEEARVAAALANIKNLGLSLDMYANDNLDRYPTTEQGLAALRTIPTSSPPKAWKGPYLKEEIPNDPWGHPFRYQFPGSRDASGYELSSAGPDGQDGTADDVNSWGSAPK